MRESKTREFFDLTQNDTEPDFFSDEWAAVWSAFEGWLFSSPKPIRSKESMALAGAYMRLRDDPQFRTACAQYYRQNPTQLHPVEED